MTIHIWLSFVGISLILGFIPGPSVCFTVAYGLKYGSSRTFPSILGQLTANLCQLFIVFVGLTSLLEQSVGLFIGLKLIGAVYLIYLGVKQWFARMPGLDMHGQCVPKSLLRSFIDGFIVCGTNPKALIYYAAFFPQFIVPDASPTIQSVILGITSILICAIVLICYTLLAGKARYWLMERGYWHIQNRVTGTFMVGAGTALALTTK